MNDIEQQRIVELLMPGDWQRLAQRLPALNLPACAGPERVPQWLAECPVQWQAEAELLLRAIGAQYWSVASDSAASLVMRCAAGVWRLHLRQIPALGFGALQRLPAVSL